MNQKVDIAEVIALSEKVATAQDKMVTDLNAVSKSIDEIISMEDFTGEAATSAKNYFTAVHQKINAAFQQLFIEIHENLEKHIENFQSSVDESDVARIERAYMEDEKEDIQTHYTNLQEQAWEVAEIIESVSDIANVTIPRLSYAETAKDEAIETMEDVETNLDTFTSQGKNEQTEELIYHIETLMKKLRTESGEARFRKLDTWVEYTDKLDLNNRVDNYSTNISKMSMDEIEEEKDNIKTDLDPYGQKVIDEAYSQLVSRKINKDDFQKVLSIISEADKEIEKLSKQNKDNIINGEVIYEGKNDNIKLLME